MHASTVGTDRVLWLVLDITDRKEAEQKLRESEERFRGLSEAAFEAILVHDGGRIVDVNHALCELVGYSWHELAGRDGFELIVPEYREAVYRNLLGEYTGAYEIEVLKRDGSRVPVEVQARSFPYRGQVLRVVAVRDISERKRAERVRESLIRELEAKNAELERFGYAVTHDLKAPLVTIRGFAEYLERDAREGRSDRLAPDAARITEAVARLQGLLDRLFELSRAGRPVGPPVAVPAAELVQEALRLLRERATETGTRVEVAPELPVVFGDRARLVQVFQNLLDNAMKFGGGRPVRVCMRTADEGRVVLVVQDTGIGIEPRHRERVLDIFERLDPRGEGAGVGLAVVKRILESQGGRVWLESEGPGAGTAACVELALEPVGAPATRYASGRASLGIRPASSGASEALHRGLCTGCALLGGQALGADAVGGVLGARRSARLFPASRARAHALAPGAHDRQRDGGAHDSFSTRPSTIASSCGSGSGFCRNASAPRRRASASISGVAFPVSSTTRVSGRRCRDHWTMSRPSMPCTPVSRRSAITTA